MKRNIFMICLIILITQSLVAQKLTVKSIKLYKSDTIQAPQSSRDNFPFLTMDLKGSTKTFLLAFCEYDITWEDPQNDKEEFEDSFESLSLQSGNGLTFKPIGDFTADQRLSFIRNPKYSDVEAREAWGAKSVRFGALFLVDKSLSDFTISFAGEKTTAKVSKLSPTSPSDFVKIQIIESELIDSTTMEDSRLKRYVPDAKVTLSNPHGKLLTVKTKIYAQAPNVMGGENRYIFRPSDFALTSEKQILEPLGYISSDRFGTDTIYNISRKKIEDLKKVEQELTLVFAVKSTFKSGELIFMDKVKGEAIVK